MRYTQIMPDYLPSLNTARTGPPVRVRYKAGIFLLLFIGIFLTCFPVSGTMTHTTPAFPLSNDRIGFFTVDIAGGYPLFNHSYAPFSDSEYILNRQHKNQTLSIFAYKNPPLFPNETVYGLYHEENGYVSWLKEYNDPRTGISRLCQVADTGEFGETPYLRNMSPADNDYLGRIGWYVVDGKLWPRTWINGSMYDGQSWSEWWGPFPPDEEGSVFKQRDAVVNKEVIPVAGNETEVWVVTISGPSEFHPGLNAVEKFYFVNGTGPVGRDLVEITGEAIPVPSVEGMPAGVPVVLPAGEKVFSHIARCTRLINDSPTLAMTPD